MPPSKPDFAVFGKAIDGEHWKRLGVAWVNSKKGVKYLRVKLDFMPNGDQLTLWPYEPDEDYDLPEPGVDDVSTK